ncbi:MAG: SlyX family protein [Bdellovibrionales bacterium]|nr:SlyX family protein [Bdellovibrionales bacterium]
MESRLNDLEMRIAYQDQIIEDLNKVVIELRREVERLNRRVEESENQEDALNLKDLAQEVPPPHY